MTIVEFLTARITEDEDEATARAGRVIPTDGFEINGVRWWCSGAEYEHGNVTITLDNRRGDYVHISSRDQPKDYATVRAAWPPSEDGKRALAEVTAKRALLELADEADDVDEAHREEHCNNRRTPLVGDRMRRTLAAVYADHPDYDEAWRV